MGICSFKALISAPLPEVWDFVSRPENLHVWGPALEPVKGIDRPFQSGDRLTFWRRDFGRRYEQKLLVEEVIPQRLLRFRVLSASGQKQMDAFATLSVAASDSPESTWVQEEISYSFGKSAIVLWLDRWLANPLMQFAVSRKSKKVLGRLEALFAKNARKERADHV
ncbi:MAG TPA: SRPBCC family protein [Planctomycetaceae bacterium]|jgi:hypothetical protein|nr:SRPBCC family protein [Planctomycetaceae bacterium]